MTSIEEVQHIINSLGENVSNFYKIDSEMRTRKTILQAIAKNGNVVKCLDAPTREYRIAAMQSNIPYIDAIIMNEIKKYPDIFDQFMIQPEELCIAAIKQNVNVVAYIRPEFQTETICKMALDIDPKIIHHLRNISNSVRISAFEQNVKTGDIDFKDVPFECQTQKMCEVAILRNPQNLIHMDCKYQTLDIIKKAVIEIITDHRWPSFPTKRINQIVLKSLPIDVFTTEFKHFLIDSQQSFANIPNIVTEDYTYGCSKYQCCAKELRTWAGFEDALYAFAHKLPDYVNHYNSSYAIINSITKVGMTIDMFKNIVKINRDFGILATNDEWKLAAISVDPFSINYNEYGKEQESNHICIAAVKKDVSILKKIHYQNFPICMEAIRANPLAMKFIKQQRPEKCIEGVRIDYRSMQYVRDQTPSICVHAMMADPRCIQFIRDQIICYTFVAANPQFEIYIKNKVEYNNFAKLYKKSGYICP